MEDLTGVSIVVVNNIDDEPPAGHRAHALWTLWSQVTPNAVRVLHELGAMVHQIDIEGADLVDLGSALRRDRPDVVVNFCETLGGDSRGEMALPSLLDVLGIPYTGSSALALGLCLHKHVAKALLRAHGVPTPLYAVVTSGADFDVERVAQLRFPLIVKPAREDASEGIDFDSVVSDARTLDRAVGRVHSEFGQPALVEEYIDGRELSIPILGNPPQALPLLQTDFGPAFGDRPRIVTWQAKWDPDVPEFIETRPCRLDADVEARVVRAAVDAFSVLGCRDYGRVDVRLSGDGVPYVIDVNPNCDLQPGYDFSASAQEAGISYHELLRRLVAMALERG